MRRHKNRGKRLTPQINVSCLKELGDKFKEVIYNNDEEISSYLRRVMCDYLEDNGYDVPEDWY